MADREFVFNQPEVQALISSQFIPLAMNDWYLRRKDDVDGKFFRKMTEESPRGQAGEKTRQGRYAFTAGGKFLGFNNNRGPERLLSMLKEALAQHKALPPEAAGSAQVLSGGPSDPKYDGVLPPGGAVIKVHTRVLERTSTGALATVTPPETPDSTYEHHGFGAATDHLWLRPEEIALWTRALADQKPLTLTAPVLHRIVRYHLVDNTRGEPPSWKEKEIKEATLTFTPTGVGKATVAGKIRVETPDGGRGSEVKMEGEVRAEGTQLKSLEWVAIGEHWGEAQHTAKARPGKQPIGFSFRLITQPRPEDQIRPQFSHWLRGYWEAKE